MNIYTSSFDLGLAMGFVWVLWFPFLPKHYQFVYLWYWYCNRTEALSFLCHHHQFCAVQLKLIGQGSVCFVAENIVLYFCLCSWLETMAGQLANVKKIWLVNNKESTYWLVEHSLPGLQMTTCNHLFITSTVYLMHTARTHMKPYLLSKSVHE